MIVDLGVRSLNSGYQDENWKARTAEGDGVEKSVGGSIGTGIFNSSILISSPAVFLRVSVAQQK
jgi:hypothetical protein